MNLSMLDREQLEDILLNPPRVEVNPLQCSDSITLDCLPTGPAERSTHASGKRQRRWAGRNGPTSRGLTRLPCAGT